MPAMCGNPSLGLSASGHGTGFESQTKTKLGSTDMGRFANSSDLCKRFHQNTFGQLPKICGCRKNTTQNYSGWKNVKNEWYSKVGSNVPKGQLHNKSTRLQGYTWTIPKRTQSQTTLFITEGIGKWGITKSRDVNTQAVFSLKGKNHWTVTAQQKLCTKRGVQFIQAALNIEESMEDLRYNKIVIATDADVDGMHPFVVDYFSPIFPRN